MNKYFPVLTEGIEAAVLARLDISSLSKYSPNLPFSPNFSSTQLTISLISKTPNPIPPRLINPLPAQIPLPLPHKLPKLPINHQTNTIIPRPDLTPPIQQIEHHRTDLANRQTWPFVMLGEFRIGSYGVL